MSQSVENTPQPSQYLIDFGSPIPSGIQGEFLYGRRNGMQAERIKGLGVEYLPTEIKCAEYELKETEQVQAMREGNLREAKQQKQHIFDLYQQSNERLAKALSDLKSAEDDVKETMKNFERARVDVNTAEELAQAAMLVTKAKRAELDDFLEMEREYS